MNTLVLSILLVVLVAAGMLMSSTKTVVERFTNTSNDEQMVSPTLKNLLATPSMTVNSTLLKRDQRTGPDPLQRELEIVPVYPVTLIETVDDSAPTNKCPDMSQYVRMDEVPCWNCTLP